VRLLITRDEASAERTAVALRAHGHEPIVAPLFAIEILSEVEPEDGPWDAILLTSVNALRGVCTWVGKGRWRDVPAFAVGDRTAQAMREQGFTAVTSAAGDVNDLADLIVARLTPPSRLLYLAGEERVGDLAGVLRARNFAVDLVQVYRVVAAQTLPPSVAAALNGEIDGVLHFSRRSAEAFLTAARNSGLLEAALRKPVHYCLSARIAEPLREAGAADVRAADRPDEAALLALISPE
jgi:uroporphyrinogen-III synthase